MALRQRQLKTEILAKKADLMKTSAQDEFAKWAKLRRSVDKGMADLEALSAWLISYFKYHSNHMLMMLLSRQRGGVYKGSIRSQIQYCSLDIDHWCPVLRGMVQPKSCSILSAQGMVQLWTI